MGGSYPSPIFNLRFPLKLPNSPRIALKSLSENDLLSGGVCAQLPNSPQLPQRIKNVRTEYIKICKLLY
jgi:hypothetical protein